MGTSEGGGGSSGSGGDSGPEEKNVGSSRSKFEHSGWVYHLGTNSIKRESCNRRFLHIKGKYVMMYKRDPHEHSGTVCFYTISYSIILFTPFSFVSLHPDYIHTL